jgi:hypothetical protein
MKPASILVAGLAVATLSIAPAKAGPPANAAVMSSRSANGPSVGRSWAAGWNLPSTACKNVYNYKTYIDCKDRAFKMSWRDFEIWWYCSSLGLK